MKKLNTGLLYYVLILAVVLFLIVNLSACNVSGNVAINGKDQVLNKFKGLHVPTAASPKTDTSKAIAEKIDTTRNKGLTGDFRYDNLFK